MSEGRATRPRGPAVLYTALSLGLVVMLTALTLTTMQPPPPTVAEFAPQAVEQIIDAPSEQSSQFGSGANGRCPPGAVDCFDEDLGIAAPSPPPVPGAGAIDVPRVRRCVGDPPRQIEDPQSPPCVPYWEGDNGGSTYRGVSRDEIRIAVPNWRGKEADRSEELAAFFNMRFEFYGRKIRLYHFPTCIGFSLSGTDECLQADAVKVDSELEAFGSLSYPPMVLGGGQDGAYYNHLARSGIVSVGAHATARTEAKNFTRYRPFQYSYVPGLDKLLSNQGEFMCKALAHRPPVHAGGTTQTTTPRVFGLLRESGPGQPAPDADVLRSALRRCGSPLAADIEYDSSASRQQHQVIALQLSDADVTSVVCLCYGGNLGNIMRASTTQAYHPEWLVTTYGEQDWDQHATTSYPQDHLPQVFGMTVHNKMLPRTDMPWYWALTEVDPGDDPQSTQYVTIDQRYKELLLMASGIQMAGPDLTPENFESGLIKARFPNPGSGGHPYYQARVAFGPNDHTLIDDVTLIYFREGETSVYFPGSGAFCYVDLGVRYGVGGWPDEAPRFFGRTQPCR